MLEFIGMFGVALVLAVAVLAALYAIASATRR